MPKLGCGPGGFFIIKILLILPILVALLVPRAAVAQSRVAGANGWLLPVACNTLSSDERMHLKRGSVNAWDITCPKGSYVYPMAAGKVIYAGCNNDGGYGCWVLINHQDGFSSIYAHMIMGSVRVQAGQQVDVWTVLGQVGWTGMTDFGPHVHWEIRHTSGRQRIDRYFNLAQMNKCDFCAADGPPVAAHGVLEAQSRDGSMVASYMPHVQEGWYLYALLALFAVWLFWQPESRLSWALNHALVLVAVLLVVTGPNLPASFASTTRKATGDTWQMAYAFMRHWEGSGCVHDPVRTNAGVTQGTYDAWRMAKGLGPASVCTSLTERQAEQIYYERYWLKSGADKLPHSMAITHFDFAVNAGPGAAAKALQRCGSDTRCYNQYRESFYRSLNNFSIYGRGWLNRVHHIRQFTEGTIQK